MLQPRIASLPLYKPFSFALFKDLQDLFKAGPIDPVLSPTLLYERCDGNRYYGRNRRTPALSYDAYLLCQQRFTTFFNRYLMGNCVRYDLEGVEFWVGLCLTVEFPHHHRIAADK
jgi:hypothetical protein